MSIQGTHPTWSLLQLLPLPRTLSHQIYSGHTLSPSLTSLFKWHFLGEALLDHNMQNCNPLFQVSPYQNVDQGEANEVPRAQTFKEALTLKVLQLQGGQLLNMESACLFKCGPQALHLPHFSACPEPYSSFCCSFLKALLQNDSPSRMGILSVLFTDYFQFSHSSWHIVGTLNTHCKLKCSEWAGVALL